MNQALALVEPYLARQNRVVSRKQLLDAGVSASWLRTQLRAGRWQRLFPGAYADFTGLAPWRSRARAALLYAGAPAALSHGSAAFHHGFTSTLPRLLEISVPRERDVVPQPGLRVHLRRRMPPAWGNLRATSPAATAVDLAAAADTQDRSIGWITDAVRGSASTVEIRDEIGRRQRVRNRTLILDLVAAADEGIESPLEYRYHSDVEVAHGLPHARLQVRQVLAGTWIRADRVYVGLDTRIELDGELGHPGGRTDRDVWRDNLAVVLTGDITLRFRWRHVALEPCTTTRLVVAALRRGGWTGSPTPCGPGCTVLG